MAIDYQVRQGDCISSIAFEHGFFGDTLWNHPNNAELKKKRQNPNVLLPGDVVFIPDKRLKEVSEPTNNVHKFRVKNTPEIFRLRLLVDGAPRAREPYELEIGELKLTGTTDTEGWLRQSIPPDARRGMLTLNEGAETYHLQFGSLDPDDEISGAQGRLRNLGYYGGALEGRLSDELANAVRRYQAAKNLQADGTLTSATRTALQQDHIA